MRICERFGIDFHDFNVIFDEEFNFEIDISGIAIDVVLSVAFRFGVENRNASKNQNFLKNHQ